jgi:D-isomer specific 2-hydroxyacid dehydrogenase, NAD binding domain
LPIDQRARYELARELLGAAPRILGQPHLLAVTVPSRDADGPVGKLLAIVGRCLEGDSIALAAANELLASGDPRQSRIQDAAAWYALLANDLTRRSPYDELMGDITRVSAVPYPIFESVLKNYAPKETEVFDDVDVLSCQHILGSIVPQFVAIRELLPRARFWEIIGKPYSANLLAIRTLEEYGFNFNADSSILPERGDSPASYKLGSFAQRHREVVSASVRRFFNVMPQAIRMSRAPILVIDDGGVLINAVGQAAKASGTTRPIVCIEQTQRGLHAAYPLAEPRRAPKGGFAVVNVAQTLSKLVLESNLIATSVIENVNSWISQLGMASDLETLEGDSPVGVVGFGSVGESVAQSLTSCGIATVVYDWNRNRTAAAKRQGYEVALSAREVLRGTNVVIAATGGSWLNDKYAIHLQDGAILASTSSGDSEFQALASWKSDQLPILDSALQVQVFDNIHGEIRCQRSDGAVVHLVNGGFPVNFDGSLDPISPSQIQLTRALMLAGVLHALGFEGDDSEPITGRTGVFQLSEALDRFIFESYSDTSVSDYTGKPERAGMGG